MISKHADCPCCKSCKESSTFRKIANLKNIGLLIYQYSFRNRDDKNEELLAEKSSKNSDAIIVHNIRNVAISSQKCLSELERYKGCLRCKYIYENAEKLLKRVHCVDKLDTIGICDHCRAKYENPCKVCCKIVKTFLASETQRKKLIKEMILWLSNVENLLEKNEIHKNLSRQAGPLSYRHSLYDISAKAKYFRRPDIGQLLSTDDTIESSSHKRPIFSKMLKIGKLPGEAYSENAFMYKSDEHINYDINVEQIPFYRSNESFSFLKVDEIFGDKDLKLKFLGKHKVHLVPFKISDQTEMSQTSFKKNKLDKSAPLQHPQRALHQDFSYVFTKEKSKDELPIIRRKSSSELIKETRERIETKLQSDKKEREDKKKALEDIKVNKFYKQEQPQPKPDRKKQTHPEKISQIGSGSLSKKRKDHLPVKDTTKEIKKKRDEKPPQLSPKKITKKDEQLPQLSPKKITKKDEQLPQLSPKKITKKDEQLPQLSPKKITKKDEHHKEKFEKKLPQLSPKIPVKKVEDNKEKIEKEKLKVKKDDKPGKSKEEKLIKTIEKPQAKEKQRDKSVAEKSMEQPIEQDKNKAYMEELQKLKAEQLKQREIERKLNSEEKKRNRETIQAKKSEEEIKTKKNIKKPDSSSLADQNSKKQRPSSKKSASESRINANINQVKIGSFSSEDLILKLVKLKQTDPNRVKMHRPKRLSKLFGSAGILNIHKNHKDKKVPECVICNDSELELDIEYIILNNTKTEPINDIIIGENILKRKPIKKQTSEIGVVPLFFKSTFQDDNVHIPNMETLISDAVEYKSSPTSANKYIEQDVPKGIIRYALSDRSFIEKGWTMLPTEKVVRKMNVYRMRPAHPEFDWFEHNKNKKIMFHDTGETLAEFDENGRGKWFYRNGKLALDYYDAEETNAQQRFVLYSNGQPDERGRPRPFTVIASFDYLGNGIVFDHAGNIRLKYNQTEGVILDKNIGPASHWKWHTLNDPPVLQQVMIDTQMAHKDPEILKLGPPGDNKVRPDNEEMLAIEFDNFIKEKSKKLCQKFKPFQIKMKALKINEQFSLKVLDQATIYLIFRDGSTNLKINIGMILDHQEIVDTDTAELGEVSNSLERLPARTNSLAGLQRSIAYAQSVDKARTERERWLRPVKLISSADKLTSAISRPLRLPLYVCAKSSRASSSCKKAPSCNLYYNTRRS